MKSSFKATALLSGSSVLSILLSLASAKIMALLIGPGGYGYYGVLQSFAGLTSIIAGLGMATGLVRLGAAAAARGEHAVPAALWRGAWIILVSLTVFLFFACWIFRQQVSTWVFGAKEQTITIVVLIVATFFTAGANVQAGVLNAYHQVKSLAKSSATSTMLVASFSILMVSIWRLKGVLPATVGGAILTCAVATFFVLRKVPRSPRSPSARESCQAAITLARFGGPYTASLLVSSGVQMAMPMLVLHLLGAEAVGFYKAATAISVGYLGFLVTAMGQDYYPRVSAIADDPKALVSLVNDQHRLVMMLAGPLILGTLAIVPYLVPLVYSKQFGPTVEILEWQLIGDLFKFSSWTMSFVILARCRSSILLLTESTVGATTLVCTWLTVRLWGLPALGISFLASYVLYYLVVWILIRREIPFAWNSNNKRMMLAAVGAAFVVRIIPMTGFPELRTAAALCLSLAAGIYGLHGIWRELFRSEKAAVNNTVAQSA